jgi:hypothetical protein
MMAASPDIMDEEPALVALTISLLKLMVRKLINLVLHRALHAYSVMDDQLFIRIF